MEEYLFPKNIILINSSAGCGKTELMADIFVILTISNFNKYSKEYDFSNILALTFTNTGVYELKKRIIEKILSLNFNTLNNIVLKLKNLKIFDDINLTYNEDILNKLKSKIFYEHYNLSVYTFDSFYKQLLHLTLYELNEQANFKLVVDDNEQTSLFKKITYNFVNEKEDVLKNYIVAQLEEGNSINYYNNFTKYLHKIHSEQFFKNVHLLNEASIDFIKNLKINYSSAYLHKMLNENYLFKSLYEYSVNYKKNNNIKLLPDITYELKRHIKNFNYILYEKLDTIYNYILIDEFQDTSETQYEIIHEFILEIISKTHEPSVFIVGDSKQSIYRWREGDWELICDKLKNKFKLNYIVNKNLIENYRSQKEIVEFNNNLFTLIVEYLAQNNRYIRKVYSNIKQQIIDSDSGYVKFISDIKPINEQLKNDCNDEKSEPSELNTHDKYVWLIPELNILLTNNITDIAILVRKNEDAKKIYNYLIDNKHKLLKDIAIISESSFNLSKSPFVRFIVYFIAYQITKNNESLKDNNYFKECAIQNLKTIIKNEDPQLLFNEIENEIQQFNFLLLPLTDQILFLKYFINSKTDISNNKLEQTFVDNLIEIVLNRTIIGEYNSIETLHWLIEEGIDNNTLTITNISTFKELIKIFTIHKVKGESFDAVIIPDISFIESSYKAHKENYLVYKSTNANNQEFTAFFKQVKEIKEIDKSNTDKDFIEIKKLYDDETEKLQVDDINLLYVATTRPKYALIINGFSDKTEKNKSKNIKENILSCEKLKELIIKCLDTSSKIDEYNNFEITTYTKGHLLPINTTHKQEEYLNKEYYLLNPICKQFYNRTPNVKYIFSEEHYTKIEKGKQIHQLLARIDSFNDIRKAKTLMQDNEILRILNDLENLISEHPQLKRAYESASLIISEQDIYYEGNIYRPDKIFLLKDETIIIDFKSGTEDLKNYLCQLKGYIKILESLGYKNIKGFILNVDKKEILEI